MTGTSRHMATVQLMFFLIGVFYHPHSSCLGDRAEGMEGGHGTQKDAEMLDYNSLHNSGQLFCPLCASTFP